MDVISRQEAIKRGLKHYFTGEPCPHGHVTPRAIRNHACAGCNRARVKRWKQASPEHKRRLARERMRRLRATPEGRARLNATNLRSKQKGYGLPGPEYAVAPLSCECCGRQKKLGIDHDHVTGAFRGWICGSCNRGMGLLGDSIDGVRRALVYLQARSYL